MGKPTSDAKAKPKTTHREKKDINDIQAHLHNASPDTSHLDRASERKRESTHFQPVIIKRTDETFRHADDILELAIHEGKSQIERPALALFMSSVAGGMIIGFTVLAVGVLAGILGGLDGLNKIAIAAVYPLGFVLCILSRTQLFTEHTATAVYPLLDKSASIMSVLKLWLTVIVGNMLGGLVIAGLLAMADDVIHAKDGYLLIANHILDYDFNVLFVSAILAGWLMAIGAWTILSTHSTSSQIICIYIATFIIGLGGLHHSIAGSVELFVAMFTSSTVGISEILPAIGVILVGNAIGGSIFVALLNHGHIRALNK